MDIKGCYWKCGVEGCTGLFDPKHKTTEEQRQWLRDTSKFIRSMTEAMTRDEEYKRAHPKPCGEEIDRLKERILPLFPHHAIPIGIAQPLSGPLPGDQIYTFGGGGLPATRTYTQEERDAHYWPIPACVAAAGITQVEWVRFVSHWWNAHFSHECTCGLIEMAPGRGRA